MTKNVRKATRGNAAPKGSSRPVEVAVGDKATRAFLVTLENHGTDGTGRLVGANGIAWKVGR